MYEYADFWLNELEASTFVKEIVTQEYGISFLKLPWPEFKIKHYSAALEHEEFVASAVQELVQTSCMSEQCPTICSPLSVVANAKGKLQLVLDLRYANQFIPEQKFRYEDISLVPQPFNKGEYFLPLI